MAQQRHPLFTPEELASLSKLFPRTSQPTLFDTPPLLINQASPLDAKDTFAAPTESYNTTAEVDQSSRKRKASETEYENSEKKQKTESPSFLNPETLAHFDKHFPNGNMLQSKTTPAEEPETKIDYDSDDDFVNRGEEHEETYSEESGNHLLGQAVERGMHNCVVKLRPQDEMVVNTALLDKKGNAFNASTLFNMLVEIVKLEDDFERSFFAVRFALSCLETAEHMAAMGNGVTDFISPDKPVSKKQVVYQLQVSRKDSKEAPNPKKLIADIIGDDEELEEKHVKVIEIRNDTTVVNVSMQKGDINQILQNLLTKDYQVADCDFDKVKLNESICYVDTKPYLDHEIGTHAITVIASSNRSGKIFLERNAGTTTGNNKFVDSRWSFNFFRNHNKVRAKRNFPKDQFVAVHIFKMN